jgi:hypothetical protein
MNRIVGTALAVGLLLLATGCAYNSAAGQKTMRVGVFFGDLGVFGDGNNVTAQNGSRLSKLSLIGNDNNVMVEDLVTLPHVEFWGSNNTVSVPEYLMFRMTQVGHGNKIIRRQITWDLGAEADQLYTMPQRTRGAAPAGGATPPPSATQPARETPPAEPSGEPDTGGTPGE